MGFFKGLSGSASPNGGSTDGGGGFFGAGLIKLLREHSGELQGGSGQQYIYNPDTQQYTAMKKGGTASSRADGIAQRGKTKGRFV